LLHILWISFACTASSSMPMNLRFGLFMVWWGLAYCFHRFWVVLVVILQFFL
jgi:hypothetical protein